MKMIKTLMILIPTIFIISGCQNLDPVIVCDSEFRQFNRCRCRCMDLREWKTVDPRGCYKYWKLYEQDSPENFKVYDEYYFLPITHPINLPPLACTDSTVIKEKIIADEVRPWIKKNRDSRRY